MELDGPPFQLPPMPPEQKRRCFCCGRKYGVRQLARHLRLFLARLDAELLAANAVEDPAEVGMDVDGEINGEEDGMPNFGQDGEDPFGNIGAEDFQQPDEPEFVHEPVHNPPVEIHEWPDPGSDHGSDAASEDEELVDGADQDPPFEEFPAQPNNVDLNALYEPGMDDEQVHALMRLELGDLAEDEWLNLYDGTLTWKDENTFRFLATRLRTHFSRQTYDELRYGPCEALGIPSEFVAYRRLRIAAGLETRMYDMCIGSCVCFLGKYADLQSCPYCHEPRFSAANRPRRSFYYTPLIPQLQALYRSHDMLEKLGYRALVENASEPGVYEDIYDGEHYRTLRATQLDPNDEYRILDDPRDLALALSTDGFSLFKRRRSGHSTAWPLIFINYNLHPRYRTHLEHIICVGVIPGPKQCKDLNSFLVPVLQELILLERGVETLHASPADDGELFEFDLRAFLLAIIGDIPAVSKMLAMKGHNAILPCRACLTRSIIGANSVQYLPLTYPGDPDGFPPEFLFMRTHADFLRHYRILDNLVGQPGPRKRYAKEQAGINDRPIFAHLKSFDLAKCAPYDIMHLLFENLVPNMIKHWIGKFKKLDQGTGNYRIPDNVWTEIGKLTAEATCTIPAAFVGTLPDIAEDRSLYKAEGYSFWVQYIAPILLLNRLPEPYYEHFLLMRDIIMLSVQLNITSAQVDELEAMVNRWVVDYERFYYQHTYERLPACPLTIHALLHIPYYIRMTGPQWATWSFIMERFCGHMLPAVKNRYQPYRHLDNYILRCAQMKVVCHTYGLPTLARSTVRWTHEGRERLSTREIMYPDFPEVILGHPVVRNVQVDVSLMNQFTKFFGPIYRRPPHFLTTGPQLRERIDTQSIVSYGRVRLVDDGDRIRIASVVERTRESTGQVRDNSFVRFTVLPDANAENDEDDAPYEEVNYGRLINIYYIEFITNLETNTRDSYLVGRIMSCRGTRGLDAALAENPLVKYRTLSTPDIFHLKTIDAVVGRIRVRENEWAIIDCSRNGARTQFVNNDDDEDD
ncbi:hypothetical protein FRC09_003998 [Ceratobasidium sp. 395]|nr:hypothetical protein FRC09_003998 [Ceratobasidium sp. 395]